MQLPLVTLGTAGVLAVLFVWLSVAVMRQRLRSQVSMGDGSGSVRIGEEGTAAGLLVAIRTHANFAEYVPTSLVLLLLLELAAAPHWALLALAALLVAGRVMHAVGMRLPAPNPLRGGIVLNWLMLLAGGLYAGYLAFALA